MKKLYAALTLVMATLLLQGVFAADDAGAPRNTSLNGSEEILGGDPDGTGSAHISLNVGKGRVCWELSVTGIDPAAAAHIHRAPAGVNGPIVVPLSPPTSGTSSGCREGVNLALVQEIIDFPGSFYVNVHNALYPAGALRGQLSNPGEAD